MLTIGSILPRARRLLAPGILSLCAATLVTVSAEASVIWNFTATDALRPGARVDGTITFDDSNANYAAGRTASLSNGGVASYTFTYTDRSGASSLVASSAADSGTFSFQVFQPLSITFGSTVAPTDVRLASYSSLAAGGGASTFTSFDLRIGASGTVLTGYAANVPINAASGSFALAGAPAPPTGVSSGPPQQPVVPGVVLTPPLPSEVPPLAVLGTGPPPPRIDTTNGSNGNGTLPAVPEPGAALLYAGGLAVFGLVSRKRRGA